MLATVWLFDAILQIQPVMFTRGASGLSGILNQAAAGNPHWIAESITWNASIVEHQPILSNSTFAGIQFLIGFGIVYTRTCKPALVLSVTWSLAVWWFGEGLGGVFSGSATPLGGGPGGVLFYALLAVLLWPSECVDAPFIAAAAVGVRTAKAIWVLLWLLLALLSAVGSSRSPLALQALVAGMERGEPPWVSYINRGTETLFLHDGATMATLLAILCLIVAAGAVLPARMTRLAVISAVVAFGLIWVAVQDFGGILAGGATDPNAAPLIILVALVYWPVAVTPGPIPQQKET